MMVIGLIIAPQAKATDRDWNESQRKANLIVEPIGWYHMKYRSNPDISSNQVVTRPSEGNRILGIVVEVTNKNRSHYYYATENKVAKFRADGEDFPSLPIPFGYHLGLDCTGSYSLRVEALETIWCLYMIELPWSISEIRMSIPFPMGKSRGYWTLDAANKRSSNYLGYQKRQWDPGFADIQRGEDYWISPEFWWEWTEKDLARLSPDQRPPSGLTLYNITFWGVSDKTTYLDAEDFQVFTYDGRELFVFHPSERSDCPIYSQDDDLAVCQVQMLGPQNLRSVRVYHDFGDEGGYWNLKLDRNGFYYLP